MWAPLSVQCTIDVALMPVDDTDQMLACTFAGRNAPELVCGVGEKGLELGKIVGFPIAVDSHSVVVESSICSLLGERRPA